jgi:thioredoxin reductase (NADPH)
MKYIAFLFLIFGFFLTACSDLDNNKIYFFTKTNCPYCQKAKFFLDELNVKYKEYSCDDNEEEMRLKLKEKYNLSNLATFPQIIVDDVNIGGYSDLIEKYNSKEIIFD